MSVETEGRRNRAKQKKATWIIGTISKETFETKPFIFFFLFCSNFSCLLITSSPTVKNLSFSFSDLLYQWVYRTEHETEQKLLENPFKKKKIIVWILGFAFWWWWWWWWFRFNEWGQEQVAMKGSRIRVVGEKVDKNRVVHTIPSQ